MNIGGELYMTSLKNFNVLDLFLHSFCWSRAVELTEYVYLIALQSYRQLQVFVTDVFDTTDSKHK